MNNQPDWQSRAIAAEAKVEEMRKRIDLTAAGLRTVLNVLNEFPFLPKMRSMLQQTLTSLNEGKGKG